MKYNPRTSRLEVSADPGRNLFRIHGDEFFLENLDKASGKGGNSSVFRAQHPDGNESYIVKFFRYFRESDLGYHQRRLQRFEREIQALISAQNSPHKDCVVPLLDHGVFPLRSDGERKSLRYYVMDEADSNLADFVQENDLSPQQKVLLCHSLLKMLRNLHGLGIYHRDIKPENILMIGTQPLFGDLGLINFRDRDSDLDLLDEKIGPIGFLSPEATNKCLGSRGKASFDFDCWMDDRSDVFQLGQVFWFILQDEVPTGHLTEQDSKFPLKHILSTVIQPMLQYGKARRATVDFVETALQPIMRDLAVI